MLVKFSVSNFCSFKDETVFSMIPTEQTEHQSQIIKSQQEDLNDLLRSGIIYGANASGKSNLVKAISYAVSLICESKALNKKFNLPFFRLDSAFAQMPARFEFQIQCDNKTYAYGFELYDSHVHQEWLRQIRQKDDLLIFERKKIDTEYSFEYGEDLKKLSGDDFQFLKFIAKGTRNNQFFLSETINRDSSEFAFIYQWFTRSIQIIFPKSRPRHIEFKLDDDPKFKRYLNKMLSLADTGIDGIYTKKRNISDEISDSVTSTAIDKLSNQLDEDNVVVTRSVANDRYSFMKVNGDIYSFQLATVHKYGDNENAAIEFYYGEESEGTQRLIDLSFAFYRMTQTQEEAIYIIDEVDRSLHPNLVKSLIESYLDSKPNPKSQLIITTHEPSLIDTNIIREDEIWFIEKDDCGASTLYSLSDFDPIDKKKTKEDYLLGRYGATPYLSGFEDLGI